MEHILIIALFVFGALGAALIVVQYCSILKRKTVAQRYAQQSSDVSEQLGILSASNTPTAKANAFIALMVSCYVLVHLMVNQGNKYNDKKQMEHFQKHWSEQQLKKLNALDGGSRDY